MDQWGGTIYIYTLLQDPHVDVVSWAPETDLPRPQSRGGENRQEPSTFLLAIDLGRHSSKHWWFL